MFPSSVFWRGFLCHILNNQNNETEEIWVAAQPAQSDDEKNVSDVELGRRLGISRQAIEAIANYRKDLTVSRLHEIAQALNVRVRELFEE